MQSEEPLASRMRPRSLDEFVGQDHILAPGRLLRRAIEADRLSSLIFYGPPGTGKTTLARIIAAHTESHFQSLNAVLAGVKEVRAAIGAAGEKRGSDGRRSILFIDEVHRWNKAQQDALLPWVENGMIILIGATTENPFFEVNKALVSRSRLFQLKGLGAGELGQILDRSLSDEERGYGLAGVSIADDAREHLIEFCNGDARNLLGALELAVLSSPEGGKKLHITREIAEESIQQKALLYDKTGDYHFDSISAFIKSLRGSDPDAALYWLARMVRSGESPRYIFRRMLISASEDVGLADPAALVQVEAASAAFERVGMPEGQFFLAQAALYISTAPKSNSALAYFDALEAVKSEGSMQEVPNHLRDASRDAEGFGHGRGYQYPHAFAEHWVAQNYLPEGLRGRIFYQGGKLGYEGERYDALLRRRELQLEVDDEPFEEILSFSGMDSEGGRSREQWISRSEGSVQQSWEELRASVFDLLRQKAGLARQSRLLLAGKGIGPLVWEALRQCPEGCCYTLFARREEEEAFRFLNSRSREGADAGDIIDRAVILNRSELDSSGALPETDIVLIKQGVVEAAISPGSKIALLSPCQESHPSLGSWLLRLAESGAAARLDSRLAGAFLEAERKLFSSLPAETAPGWAAGGAAGFADCLADELLEISTQRIPGIGQLRSWFANAWYREGLEQELGQTLPRDSSEHDGHIAGIVAELETSSKTPESRICPAGSDITAC